MTLATTFLAATLVVPSMPPPEYDDCEVVTNCVFDASRDDAKMFAVRIELDATLSNGVEVVFGRDDDGYGILSRTEEAMAVGYDCGEWKTVNLVTGDKFTCDGASGRIERSENNPTRAIRSEEVRGRFAADALVAGNNRRNCLSLVAYGRGGRVLARNYSLFNYVPKGFTIRFR